jgi:hypothetical protein
MQILDNTEKETLQNEKFECFLFEQHKSRCFNWNISDRQYPWHLDKLFSSFRPFASFSCENAVVKNPKRIDIIISLLSVEFFDNKLTSFCQVLGDIYISSRLFFRFF